MTPSIYGPFATALQTAASLVGGANLRETVWVWQVLVVASWLGVRALLLRAAHDGGERRRVEQLWTWNPVLFGVAVLGAHVDLIATALGVAALVLASRSPAAGGLVLGLVVSTKITYAVVGLAILWSWRRRERADLVRRSAVLLATALVVLVPLHLWAGRHVFDQLLKARRSVSLATPWRLAVELLTGPLSSATVRSLVSVAALVISAALVLLLARLVGLGPGLTGRERSAQPDPGDQVASGLRATFVLGTAYTLGAPYSLPWYDALTWATLPAVGVGLLERVLLARFAVMALAYVPGRVVDLSAGVQAVTLGVRRHVAPYAGLLTWLVIAAAALRRSAENRPDDAAAPLGEPLDAPRRPPAPGR